MHVPEYMAAIPGFMSKKSVEYNLAKGGAKMKGIVTDPYQTSWADYTEKSKMVIGGSPDTVAQQLEERSEEHTSELQSLMRISYAVFCLKKKNENDQQQKRC